MSELSDRMIQDMKLAGLVDGTRREYLRAVRQLTAFYMVPPDRLTERQVQDYILYVRDDLGVAKGTFAPLLAGLKFYATAGRRVPSAFSTARPAAWFS